MSEVRRKDGSRINWRRPPAGGTICSLVLLDSGGSARRYRAGFRTLCHLNQMNNRAKRKYGHSIRVLQPPWNTSVSASAGTHDKDAVWDLFIPGVSWWEQQRFFRANGFGCWYRHPPTFGNHIHGFTLPPHRSNPVSDDFKQAGMKVGKYVDGGISIGRSGNSSQIRDYYNHAFGLSGQHSPNSDRSWYPRSIVDTIFNLSRYVRKRAS